MSSTPSARSTSVAPDERPLVRIEPSRGFARLQLGEVWKHRELLFFLSWRDVKVRYKQTALGIVWAGLQPLLTLAVFALVFGRVAGIAPEGVSYGLFALAGLVPWTFFSTGVGQSANSVVAGANLITKVYFPRLVMPIAAVAAGVIDLLVACVALALFIIVSADAVDPAPAWIPVSVVLMLATSLGVGFWLSAANVRYRDVRYALPFLTQMWLFASPIAYPRSLLSEPWRGLLALNPLTGVIESFRGGVLGTSVDVAATVTSAAVAFALVVTGAIYFRRMERSFADIV